MKSEAAIDTLAQAAAAGDHTGFEAHMELLRTLLGQDLLQTEAALPDHLGVSVYPLVETGRHLLDAGGKRIRPILTLLAAACYDRQGEHARALAAAGEMVHLATLLHDDVIDDADVRRGRSTARVVWSNTASVLGGDYALTRALELVGSTPVREPLQEAIETLRLLVEGEILQLQHRGRAQLTRQDYFEVVDRKTASLFAWCCRAGAHLARDPVGVAAMGAYGSALGICFQIVDDVLDWTGDQVTLGKEPLADLRDGKLTLPMLLATERDEALAAKIRAALGDAAKGTLSEDDAAAVELAVRGSGALEEARALGFSYAKQASDALAVVPPSPWRDALQRIAEGLGERMR